MSGIPKDVSFPNPSGITGGVNVLVVTATTSGGAQTIHTAGGGTDNRDFLSVWAINVDASARTCTLVIDGTDFGPFNVNRLSTPIPLIENLEMHSAKVAKVFASVTSMIIVIVRIKRMQQAAD